MAVTFVNEVVLPQCADSLLGGWGIIVAVTFVNGVSVTSMC